jgi:excisionase family DNA binding protein
MFSEEDSMNEERLLRLPEVSERLALSRTAIYRLMARGKIEPVRIGGALRFTASSISQLIEDMKGEVHAEAV